MFGIETSCRRKDTYMKATGIVRRIDDLGRIVIPKEIRKTLKIQEGSPLEIFTDSEGGVIFRKYSPIGEMADLAVIYAQSISTVLGKGCVITDTDRVIAVAGIPKKDLMEKNISERLRLFISQKKNRISPDEIQICEGSDKSAQGASAVVSSGDPMGSVLLVGCTKVEPTEHELLRTVALLLGKQAE